MSRNTKAATQLIRDLALVPGTSTKVLASMPLVGRKTIPEIRAQLGEQSFSVVVPNEKLEAFQQFLRENGLRADAE